MDPQTAWEELLATRHERDWDRAAGIGRESAGMDEQKRFPPNTVGHSTIGRIWHRAVTQFVCMMTLNNVNAARTRLSRKRP